MGKTGSFGVAGSIPRATLFFYLGKKMKIGEVEEGKGKEGGRRDGTGTMNESVQKM